MDLVASRKAPWLECLEYADPNQRAYRYEMESTALSVRESAAEFRVDGNIEMLIWTVRFDTSADERDKVTEMIEHALQSGNKYEKSDMAIPDEARRASSHQCVVRRRGEMVSG